MQLFSDDYLNLNKRLHESNEHYGESGSNYSNQVMQLSSMINSQDVLDYGCGKSTLAKSLPFKIKQYDPAIPKYSESPEPADIVVCTDVLEHIEPEYIDNVLDHIQQLARKAVFLSIATCNAKKILEDGRNAHLIVKPLQWWLPRLWERFQIINFMNCENYFQVVVAANNLSKARGEIIT